MVEQALNCIGEDYIEQILDFQELECQMETDAERIAQENRQRNWERAHGGGVAHG